MELVIQTLRTENVDIRKAQCFLHRHVAQKSLLYFTEHCNQGSDETS